MNIKIEPNVKALIFDFDGTLADTMPIHYRAWQEVASNYGFEYPEQLFYKNAGMSTGKIVSCLNDQGYRLDPDTIIQAKNTAYLKLAVHIEPIKPVFDIVTRYYQKIPMALGTGECRAIALSNIKAAGLDKYFQVIVTADEVTNPKPDPETFLECARLMGVPPEVCQVFEDGELGLEAARRAGMIATDVRPYTSG